MSKPAQPVSRAPDVRQRVKIGHVVFDVVPMHEAPRKERKERNFGFVKFREARIFVDDTVGASEQVDTLFHEVLHVIYRNAGMSTDATEESVVTALATGLTTVFYDNPRLLRWVQATLSIATLDQQGVPPAATGWCPATPLAD